MKKMLMFMVRLTSLSILATVILLDTEPVWKKTRNVGGDISYSGENFSQDYSHVKKKMDVSTTDEVVIQSPVNGVDKLDSVSSVTPSSSGKKMVRNSSFLRSSRLRARRLIHFGPGMCGSLRPRSLHFSGASTVSVGSSFSKAEVTRDVVDEEVKLDGSFEQVKGDIDDSEIEAMDIDSLDEMSVDDSLSFQPLMFDSCFYIGDQTPVLKEGCFIPLMFGSEPVVTARPIAADDEFTPRTIFFC